MAGRPIDTLGARAFGRLGRAIVRRPYVPIAFWVLLVVATVPFLPLLGTVTTNSTTTLPSNAPSAVADAKLAELFPGTTANSSAVLLFYGPDATGAVGQAVVQNVTSRLLSDPTLADVSSVDTVYTAYAGYLAGQTLLASGAIAAAQAGSPNLTVGIQESAALLWGPTARFEANWLALINGSSGPWNAYNGPAYQLTTSQLNNSTAALAVLSAFYNGYNSSDAGFNGTFNCAAQPTLPNAVACADNATRANVGLLAPHLVGLDPAIASATLAGLGSGNFTSFSAVRSVGAVLLGASTGFPPSWILRVWLAFPTAPPTAAEAAAWAGTTVAGTTLANEPLPVPLSLSASFVNARGTATLVLVSFSVSDEFSVASGAHPVYNDLGVINTDVAQVLASNDPGHTLSYYETGAAPLNQLTQQSVDATLAYVLPLTVGLLLGISMLYFRSVVAPLVAFAGLGLALLLGLGGTVLLGTVVSHVDSTSLTLEEVFVLGVGTDYSIFLLARYREELGRGVPSDEAIVTSLTWAGQSVATSGSTAILVTAALAFSGVALLSQWGMVLSVAILITMLLALTLVPAFLKLIGPRIFWPLSGERERRAARAIEARARAGRGYFVRAARASERRPGTIVGVVAVVSVPLIAIALSVPVSFDFYGQLPSGHAASDGLAELGTQFGNGYALPSYALVTFASPLAVGNATNATEFLDLANLTSLATDTAGIAAVRSPIGPYGAPLGAWLGLSNLSPAERTNLLGLLGSYVGTDQRTVLLQIQPTDIGLSEAAVRAVESVESAFASFRTTHPEVSALAYGGGAPVISDLNQQTVEATDVMIVAVTIGLVVVLLVMLRSWIIATMAVATIGLSISWAWALTDLVFQRLLGLPVFFYVRTIMFMLVLGLGIDYNIFLLTRVREERLKGQATRPATSEAVARTGGIITAAAIILASAFGALLVGQFTLIRAIGFSVAIAVVLDAMVVRTYLVPALLQILDDRVWSLTGRRTSARSGGGSGPPPSSGGPGNPT